MRATANHQTATLKYLLFQVGLSSEAKVILSMDPVKRTDEQIRICQNNRHIDK